jgi:hypothetical protein
MNFIFGIFKASHNLQGRMYAEAEDPVPSRYRMGFVDLCVSVVAGI